MLAKVIRAAKLLAKGDRFDFLTAPQGLQESDFARMEQLFSDPDAARATRLAFEREFAARVGPGGAVSFGAARMGFFSLLKLWRIGPGDEVVLPAFTCAVMVNAVWRSGAVPVFADIDPESFGSLAASIEERLNPRTRLIVAQHSFGIPCEIAPIVELAKAKGIKLVEDCALTLDSRIEGRSVGNFGDAALFSIDHTKPINGLLGGLIYSVDTETVRSLTEQVAGLPLPGERLQRLQLEEIRFEWKNQGAHGYRTKLKARLKTSLANRMGRSRLNTFYEADYEKEPEPADYPYPCGLPAASAYLGLKALACWPETKAARQEGLKALLKILNEAEPESVPSAYQDARREITPLRLAFGSPRALEWNHALSAGLEVEARWFREPAIGSRHGVESLGYVMGRCPNAERLGKEIVNLPLASETQEFTAISTWFARVSSAMADRR